MLRKIMSVAIATIGLTAVSSASHAYQTFTGLDVDGSAGTRASFTNSNAANASFQSFLSGVGTETFEGFLAGTTPPIGLTFPGAGTATLTGGSGTSIASQGPGTNGVGRYPHSGTKYVETDATSFVVTFGSAVGAFGFYGMDIGEFGGDLIIVLHQSGGGTVSIDVPNTATADGSALYFGLIAQNSTEQFTSIDFTGAISGGGDVFAFDDMTVGSLGQVCQQGCTVPEPGSLPLIGLALLGLAAARRRKIV